MMVIIIVVLGHQVVGRPLNLKLTLEHQKNLKIRSYQPFQMEIFISATIAENDFKVKLLLMEFQDQNQVTRQALTVENSSFKAS